jgi:formylmethanofuran dehydrogenase subunit B
VPDQLAQNPEEKTLHRAVTCPFCGLLCDKLTVEQVRGELRATDNACPQAKRAYARALPDAPATVNGKPVELDTALAAASRMLKRSRQPLIGGLGTDVDGTRAALALAERCGAIVDHLHGRALARNVRVLQTRGFATTTLAEVRNRADLVVLCGVDINDDFHNFASTCLRPADALVPERLATRRIFHLGPAKQAPRHAGLGVENLACGADELLETLNTLRALRGGRQVRLKGKRLQALSALTGAIAASEYAVFVWAPGQLGEDGDLVISAVCDFVNDINRVKRAAGLSLGGNDGGQSALATCTWQTGYPLHVSYGGTTLDYDPLRHDTARLLASGDVDALLWVSTFNPLPPPDSALPLIVIGTPGTPVRQTNSVFLPAGTPGLDHRGQLIRSDGVVALPLPQLRARALPPCATLLHELLTRLG